jgi:hypothetical protein
MRAPDAPIGWPSAQAPPLTFSLSGDAQLLLGDHGHHGEGLVDSHRSTSATSQPAFFSALRMAGTGAVVNRPGSWAWAAWLTTRATIGKPRRLATLSRVMTRAAAPSLIELELAAVMPPSRLKAGRRVGILVGSAFRAFVDARSPRSPLRVTTVTGRDLGLEGAGLDGGLGLHAGPVA